jgi:hypothetical protein
MLKNQSPATGVARGFASSRRTPARLRTPATRYARRRFKLSENAAIEFHLCVMLRLGCSAAVATGAAGLAAARGGAAGGSAPAGGGASADGSAPAGGCRLRCPKLGLLALHADTSCRSICGNGLLALGRCGVPCMMGRTQSTCRPSPDLAPPRTNPACWHAVKISAQGPWRGAACSAEAAPRIGAIVHIAISVRRMVLAPHRL